MWFTMKVQIIIQIRIWNQNTVTEDSTNPKSFKFCISEQKTNQKNLWNSDLKSKSLKMISNHDLKHLKSSPSLLPVLDLTRQSVCAKNMQHFVWYVNVLAIECYSCNNTGAGHFGAAVSAPPSRRWDFSALGYLGTGRFGADRFGTGHVCDGTRAV